MYTYVIYVTCELNYMHRVRDHSDYTQWNNNHNFTSLYTYIYMCIHQLIILYRNIYNNCLRSTSFWTGKSRVYRTFYYYRSQIAYKINTLIAIDIFITFQLWFGWLLRNRHRKSILAILYVSIWYYTRWKIVTSWELS